MQSDLKSNHHVEENVTKANQILAMIQRNVHVALKSPGIIEYNTFVQPKVWSPWQSYLEDALEKVQCQTA